MKYRIEHVIIGLCDAGLFYFFYIKQINEWVLLIGLGISFFLLSKVFQIEDRISLREAKQIALKEAKIAQQNNEIENGTIQIFDAGLQEYVFENSFKPWKYLIGLKVYGDKTYYYLATVSLNGSMLSLAEKVEGWSLNDEPRIITVTAPEVEVTELPPKESIKKI